MSHQVPQIVLGSRSPQRLNLLRDILDDGAIETLPARSSEEAGFDGLSDWASLEQRQLEISQTKFDDVASQVAGREPLPTILTADTVIVVTEESGALRVLGQPPTTSDWDQVVREWFVKYYFERQHWAMSTVCAGTTTNQMLIRVVKTRVTFNPKCKPWLDWYLGTGEPRGKAGGYAIQGIGSFFVSHIEGSISNVVGLPLRETIELLDELNIPLRRAA